MEMASTHGLALKLVEMNRLDRINRNEYEIHISEEDKLIKSWVTATNQRFSRLEYVNLTRKTLMFVLSQSSLKEIKKKDLLRGVSLYFNKCASALKNQDICRPLIDIIVDPWKNKCFSWEELFQKRITFREKKVQEYFCIEPEEIVMARVHWFALQGKDEMAMTLAKNCFLYYSRIARHFVASSESQTNPVPQNRRRGRASMDWYLAILQKKKSLVAIYNEVKQLTCHEGVLLIQRLRRNKSNLRFALTLLQLFLMQELVQNPNQSKFCCTKKIFSLWCILHKELKSSLDAVSEEIRKTVALYAPSSAHFYLLVDALWEQFGSSFMTLYVELYIRGLTADLNHLESARHGVTGEDVVFLESHIASMFAKLSTLFSDFHEGASRECMFSAFSLKPTKERLYILQSLTHSILSAENEMKSSSAHDSESLHECKCLVKCPDVCKTVKEFHLDHPILSKSIPGIQYSVVKDLVTVLESVRCVQFQYNLFDWHNNATDLGDYLRDFTLSKSWESDTEYASDGSVKSDEEIVPAIQSSYEPTKMEVDPLSSAKRKSESDNGKELFSLDVGANIEVSNEGLMHKRIKVVDKDNSSDVNNHGIFNMPSETAPNFSSSLRIEDAIENVIRLQLDSNRLKSDLSMDSSHSAFMNQPSDRISDGTENMSLSSTFKQLSENSVYPYSLTVCGKKKNLNTDYKARGSTSAVKPEVENSANYAYFASKPSTAPPQVLTPPHISRESVISPVVNTQNTVQEQSPSQISQNKFLTVNAPSYSRAKDTAVPVRDTGKKILMYQQEALNSVSKGARYEPVRSVSNTITQSSQLISKQTAIQLVHKSDISGPNFPKVQCLPNTSVASSSTVTSPIERIQSKVMQMLHKSDISKVQCLPNTSVASSSPMTSPPIRMQSKGTSPMQPHGYPLISHASKSSSVVRTDSRYQVSNSSAAKSVMKRVDQSISCFQDNQYLHCDRSSVIQHTMQHVKEHPFQSQSYNIIEMPNQLTVSVDSNAAEQIRSVPTKDVKNLPPFTVNVSDITIPNSNLAVPANFVIARKPQPQAEVSSPQAICSDLATVSSTDTITIPGILASPSVIVSPWEAQRKVHGEMLYKKKASAVNIAAIDKRIYKNRLPHGKQVYYKPDLKMIRHKVTSDKNSPQVLKAIASPGHIDANFHVRPSMSQSSTNPNQSWTAASKSSTQSVSQSTTTSQPWYSEPYPKPFNSGNTVSCKSNEKIITVAQNASSSLKMLQPVKQTTEVKSVTLYTKQIKLSNNRQMIIPSTSTPSFNNSIPSCSTKSSVLNVDTFSSPISSTTAVSSKNALHTDHMTSSPSSASQSNMISIKPYTTASNPVKNNSVYPSQLSNQLQLSTEIVQGENYLPYKVPDTADSNLHYSQDSSKNYPSACCSPSEMNPCQTCSLPAENRSLSSVSNPNSGGCTDPLTPTDEEMILGNDVVSTSPCNSNTLISGNADVPSHSNTSNAPLASCQYCSHSFLESELRIHILNCPSKELGVKNDSLGQMNTNVLLPENLLSSPEHNSLFQEQSFESNLPHVKPFMNTVDNPQSIEDKNLFEIDDADAFNECMDLINNDNDLKRIVQGIDSLSQLDNDNYLPFVPPADNSDNLLNTDLCSEMKNEVCAENPLLESLVSDGSGGFANYAADQLQLHRSELEKNKSYSLFEFADKGSKSRVTYSKPQTSFPERNSANASKISNKFKFETVSEMIVTVSKKVKSKTCSNDYQKEIAHTASSKKGCKPKIFECSYCPKKLISEMSRSRHILRVHPNVHTGHLSGLLSEEGLPSMHVSGQLSEQVDASMHSNNTGHSSAEQVQPIRKPKICKCPYCPKKLISEASKSRHIARVHPDKHASYLSGLLPEEVLPSVHANSHDQLSESVNCSMDASNSGRLSEEVDPSMHANNSGHLLEQNHPSVHATNSGQLSEGHHSSVHSNDSGLLPERFCDLSSPNEKPRYNFLENDVNCGSENSYHDSNSFHSVLHHDSKQNSPVSDGYETPVVLPKSRIKDIIKSPTAQCKFCNKTLTVVYMKKHILKLHPETLTKTGENVSSDLNLDANPISQPQVDPVSASPPSPLLEQDIDSSTCLSMSDALKRNNSFMVAETPALSGSSGKFVENTDVKFNFNELSKDTKIGCRLSDSEQKAPLSLQELPSKNSNRFEGNIKSKSSGVKQISGTEPKHVCDICTKTYSSVSVLKRHLRNSHKIVNTKTSKKSTTTGQSNETGIQIEEDKPISSYFPKASNTGLSSNQNASHLNKIPHAKKVSHSAINAQKIKERHKGSTAPTSKQSLLKAVLQSNFVSKQLDVKGCNESKETTTPRIDDNPAQDSKLNFCDTPKMSEGDENLHNVELIASEWLRANKDCGNSKEDIQDSGVQSDNKVSVSVPLGNLSKTEIPSSSENCLYGLVPDTNVCNSPLPSNFKFPNVENEVHVPSENSDIRYADLVNSQSSSVQSNEISPISEIISNVSKCQFGGTSNNDNEKEVFEDNSLKLLIPESQGKSKSNEKESECLYGSYDMKSRQKQELVEMKSVGTSDEPDLLSKAMSVLTAPDSLDSMKEIGESEELEEQAEDINKDCVKCRLCFRTLNSTENLSKHLKEIHEIPVLKKRVSIPSFSDELIHSEKPEKLLSPPKLKLGTHESESESELDNPQSWPQPGNSSVFNVPKEALYDSSELETSKAGFDCSDLEVSKEIESELESYKDALCDSSELESYKEALCDSLELDVSKEVLGDSSELDVSKEVLGDSLELDVSKEVLSASSELDAQKEVLCAVSELDATKAVLCDSSELDATKAILCDSSELDASEVLCGSSKLDAPKEVLCGSSKLDEPKEVLCGSSKLDAPKEVLCGSSKLDEPKEVLCGSSKLDAHKEVLCGSSKLDAPKEALCYPPELDASKEILCDSSKLDASKEILCDSSKLDASKEILCDSSKLDASKEILCDSSKLDASKEILCDSSKLDASKEILCDSSKLDAPEEALCDSSELDAPEEVVLVSSQLVTCNNDVARDDNLCTLSKQGGKIVMHSSPCKVKKSSIQLEHEGIKKCLNSLTLPTLNVLIPKLNQKSETLESSECKSKSKWRSFSNISSVLGDNLPCDSRNSSSKKIRKSASLPNLKIAFPPVSSQNKPKLTSPEHPLENHADIEHSSKEQTSFSTAIDNTEAGKSSCDSSSSSSSSSHNNPPAQWKKITINSSFILPNTSLSSSVPRVHRRKTILRSKISGRKLIIQRLRTYEKQKKRKRAKNSDFTRRKRFKSKKTTFSPIILTLKETTEISEFLKTHKQPSVKLIRLKENEFDYVLNEKDDPVSKIIDKYDMKEAVVKLERMDIPCDIVDKMVLIDEELIVPSLLSQDSQSDSITLQSDQNKSINYPNAFYLASGNAGVLPEVPVIHSPPREDIELTLMNDSDSNDSCSSIQFLGAVPKQQKCQLGTDEFCTTAIPSTKKCFVVLNRVSV